MIKQERLSEKQMEGLLTYINSISPLQGETFADLLTCFKPLKLSKNEFFIRKGQYARRFGFLKKGVVRAFFLSEDGKEYNKQFFVNPSIIGSYASLLTKQANQIAQQALTDCEVLVADFEDLEKRYDKFHDLERLGRKIAEFYFLEKEQKEIEMALLDADKRYLIMRKRFPNIEDDVAQYHIASYLGITPTQLSRIRRKLKDA